MTAPTRKRPDVNPQILALHDLQVQDRNLTILEHRLSNIPAQLEELDRDLSTLADMLEAERKRLDETLAFKRAQEEQMAEEQRIVQESKAKMSQVQTTRELSALQRQIETTKRMADARAQEIAKIEESVAAVEARIAEMEAALDELRAKAEAEKAKLVDSQGTLEKKVARLRKKREKLVERVDPELLRTYDRIRRRHGGIAFAPASEERCLGCKMRVPHLVYAQLVKGETIPHCEYCGRLLYWAGHFPEEAERRRKREAERRERLERAGDDSAGT
ncbi:MAG: hypothetical protein D6705_14210 [Deltaproteobacteria bacterium]|nr:MAG: hypothetical protein D6705_14210 [Deltaproteobacteria bacterium]